MRWGLPLVLPNRAIHSGLSALILVLQLAAVILCALLVWHTARFRGRRFALQTWALEEKLNKDRYIDAERIARISLEQVKSFHFRRREYELLAIHNLANVFTKQLRDDDAEPLLRQLIQDGHLYPKRDLVRQNAILMLSSIHGRRREYDAEIALLLEAKAISSRVQGEHSVVLAAIKHQLGLAYTRVGNTTLAAQSFERAACLFHGHAKREEAAARINLALAHSKLGRHEEALLSFEDVLRIRERLEGADHPEVARVLLNMGFVLKRLGKLEQAEVCYRRALAIREKAFGPDHDDVAGILNNLADLLCFEERYDEAEQLIERAIAILEHSGDERLPNALDTLATLRAAQGRIEDASALYYRSRKGLQKLDARFRQTVLDSFEQHAQVLDRLQRTAEADSLRVEASRFRQTMIKDDQAKPEFAHTV